MKTLLFGYGNADREDDGVAWHVLREIMRRSGLPVLDDLDIDLLDPQTQVHYVFQLQLIPEIADDLIQYDRVCFIDAHTGAIPEEVHLEVIKPCFQRSPLTHHLTAASLLSITETIHHKVPETILISIRGYRFGFGRSLSPDTEKLVAQAADSILTWLSD